MFDSHVDCAATTVLTQNVTHKTPFAATVAQVMTTPVTTCAAIFPFSSCLSLITDCRFVQRETTSFRAMRQAAVESVLDVINLAWLGLPTPSSDQHGHQLHLAVSLHSVLLSGPTTQLLPTSLSTNVGDVRFALGELDKGAVSALPTSEMLPPDFVARLQVEAIKTVMSATAQTLSPGSGTHDIVLFTTSFSPEAFNTRCCAAIPHMISSPAATSVRVIFFDQTATVVHRLAVTPCVTVLRVPQDISTLYSITQRRITQWVHCSALAMRQRRAEGVAMSTLPLTPNDVSVLLHVGKRTLPLVASCVALSLCSKDRCSLTGFNAGVESCVLRNHELLVSPYEVQRTYVASNSSCCVGESTRGFIPLHAEQIVTAVDHSWLWGEPWTLALPDNADMTSRGIWAVLWHVAGEGKGHIQITSPNAFFSPLHAMALQNHSFIATFSDNGGSLLLRSVMPLEVRRSAVPEGPGSNSPSLEYMRPEMIHEIRSHLSGCVPSDFNSEDPRSLSPCFEKCQKGGVSVVVGHLTSNSVRYNVSLQAHPKYTAPHTLGGPTPARRPPTSTRFTLHSMDSKN